MIERMRKPLVASTLVAVSLALAACANAPASRSGADARQVVIDAFRRTSDAGSAHAAFQLTANVPGRAIDLNGTAAYQMDPHDLASIRERVVMQIPPLTFGMAGGEVELRVTDGPVLYVRAPMLASYLHVTTPWLKLDPSEVPNAGDGTGALGSMAGVADPSALLGMLQSSISAETIGVEPIDGADTTHYQVTVDVAGALSSFANAIADQERKQVETTLPAVEAKLKAAGLERIPFDVWVDGDGFVKRMRASVDLSALEPQGPAPAVSITMTLSDVGQPVDVRPPPAGQVTDLSDLMAAAPTPSP